MQLIDEREGRPSASSANRWVRCPGSFLLEKTQQDKPRASTRRGIRLHAVLEGKASLDSLCAADAVTVKIAMDREGELFDKMDMHGALQFREQRLWNGEDHIWSAKSDVVHTKGKVGLVINYKTGITELMGIERDWQMTAEGVAASINHGLESVMIARIQPLAKVQVKEKWMDLKIIEKANQKLTEAAIVAMSENAPFRVGPIQCEWCKAKGICDAFQNLGKIFGQLSDLGLEERADLVAWAHKAQESAADILINAIKLLQHDPDGIAGWELTTEGELQKINI